jgi:hypothetical protein
VYNSDGCNNNYAQNSNERSSHLQHKQEVVNSLVILTTSRGGGGRLGIFLFTTVSRTALGPTQPPIQWVSGALSLGVKRPGREADHSSPSSAQVKECVEIYLHSFNTPSWRGAQLKYRDNFTFTFILTSSLELSGIQKALDGEYETGCK